MEWVLSRALMHYKAFPLAGIPKNQRVAALRMQIRQWSPFASPGSCVVLDRDSAMVWLWDKARVDAAIAEAGLASARVRVVPETLLAPQLNDGLRLINTLDGVEGQVWSSNQLAASRWWPAPPAADQWLAFQRDAGIAEHIGLPAAAQTAPLLAEPWARAASLEDYRALDTRNERLIYAIGVVVLAAPTFWYSGHLLKLGSAISAKNTELAELNVKAQPVISARNEAQTVLLRTQELLAVDPYPDQLQLMAAIADVLPKNGNFVKEWNYQTGKLKVTIAISDPGVQNSALVSALQTAGPFNNVRSPPAATAKTWCSPWTSIRVRTRRPNDRQVPRRIPRQRALRLLLAGVVAVLWIYAAMSLRDLAVAKTQQYIGLEKQIARIRLQASQEDWPKRLESVKLAQVELEGRLWQNSTQGLAQAAFQDWLAQATIRASLGRPAVTMLPLDDKGDAAPPTDGAAAAPAALQLWKVRAKVEFDFTPPGLMNLLKQVAMNPQQVVVESLNIRKEPVPRADMLLVANFQKAKGK